MKRLFCNLNRSGKGSSVDPSLLPTLSPMPEGPKIGDIAVLVKGDELYDPEHLRQYGPYNGLTRALFCAKVARGNSFVYKIKYMAIAIRMSGRFHDKETGKDLSTIECWDMAEPGRGLDFEVASSWSTIVNAEVESLDYLKSIECVFVPAYDLNRSDEQPATWSASSVPSVADNFAQGAISWLPQGGSARELPTLFSGTGVIYSDTQGSYSDIASVPMKIHVGEVPGTIVETNVQWILATLNYPVALDVYENKNHLLWLCWERYRSETLRPRLWEQDSAAELPFTNQIQSRTIFPAITANTKD